MMIKLLGYFICFLPVWLFLGVIGWAYGIRVMLLMIGGVIITFGLIVFGCTLIEKEENK
jgi:hypothetical protein